MTDANQVMNPQHFGRKSKSRLIWKSVFESWITFGLRYTPWTPWHRFACSKHSLVKCMPVVHSAMLTVILGVRFRDSLVLVLWFMAEEGVGGRARISF